MNRTQQSSIMTVGKATSSSSSSSRARHLPTCDTFLLKVARKENERASERRESEFCSHAARPNDDTVRQLRSRRVKASSSRNERELFVNDDQVSLAFAL